MRDFFAGQVIRIGGVAHRLSLERIQSHRDLARGRSLGFILKLMSENVPVSRFVARILVDS